MEITNVRASWREPEGFVLERNDTGNKYIFIQFITMAQVLVNGEITEVEPGSCIIYDKHSYQYMVSKEPLIHDWLHLEGTLDEIAAKYGFRYNTIYKVKNSGVITEIIRELEEEFLLKPEHYEDFVRIKIEELILKIIRLSNDAGKISHINIDTLSSFLLFRQGLSRKYSKQWTIPEMAEAVGFSQARFCVLYKEIFGVSPKADLRMIRLEQAKILLLRNKYSVNTVGEMCGYTNRFHFIRSFKKATGRTPSEYAKNKSENRYSALS